MIKNDEWFVETILDERVAANGKMDYYVKWQGFPLEDCSWIPEVRVSDDSIEEWVESNERMDEIEADVDSESDTGAQTSVGSAKPGEATQQRQHTPRFDNVECIIASNSHSYLLSQKANGMTGIRGESFWCEHQLVEETLVKKWNELHHHVLDALENQIEADDFEASPGALFMAEYDYLVDNDLLVIRRKYGGPAANEANSDMSVAGIEKPPDAAPESVSRETQESTAVETAESAQTQAMLGTEGIDVDFIEEVGVPRQVDRSSPNTTQVTDSHAAAAVAAKDAFEEDIVSIDGRQYASWEDFVEQNQLYWET